MSYPLTQLVEVSEHGPSSITDIARQPRFPFDRIKIEEKLYEVRELWSDGTKEGQVRFRVERVES